jgi:tyrosyl-tRNA synthetase
MVAAPKQQPRAPQQSSFKPQSKKDKISDTKKKEKDSKQPSSAPSPAAPMKREWNAELQADYECVLSVGEECVTESELQELLRIKGTSDTNPYILYDGFEPSGRMHIAQGVFKAVNVNKCVGGSAARGKFVFWVADWFALMNDKMGGDLEKIAIVGEYLIEVWKAAGMNLQHVEFQWASKEISEQADTYWPWMLDIGRRFNITRIKKCCQIMGRLEGTLTAAQVLYPLMQCTDVFFLKADICQLGVDQRKVNMLAREYCDAAKRKYKPIILSHHMLYGLKAGQEKMSKSDPDSAIFMEDAAQDVERKIRAAYCPRTPPSNMTTTMTNNNDKEDDDAGKASLQLVADELKNPCLDYIRHIILSPPYSTFDCNGKQYTDFDSIRNDFINGIISEDKLKTGLVNALNGLLEPVRKHFETDPRAKELLSKVREFKKESSSTTTSSLRRLNLVELSKVAKESHLVFAPHVPSSSQPTLQEVMDLVTQLRQGDQQQPCVLWLPDWSARVCNAFAADPKAIAAYYEIIKLAIRVLDPQLFAKTQIILQSEAIFADPSNYWISVIHVGRHFLLDTVMGDSLNDGDGVGYVIARLMRVADVLAVSPKSAIFSNPIDAQLAEEFVTAIQDKLGTNSLSSQLPKITTFIATIASSLRLQPERESDALRTENDEYFVLDDPKVHGKSKISKAFCEPGNIQFCPPLSVVNVLAFGKGSAVAPSTLTVSRSEQNGGDKIYESADELAADFAAQHLHPGDLKAAVASTLVIPTLEALTQAVKADPVATNAAKTLKTFAKKSNKK